MKDVSGYELDPMSDEVRLLVRRLVVDREAYLSGADCPDMVNEKHRFVLYRLRGSDTYSRIGQAIEGQVLSEVWAYSPLELASLSSPIEPTTTWMILVDVAPEDGPRPVGAMSIADCVSGPSETLLSAIEVADLMGIPVPASLQVSDVDERAGLWDVMQVAVLAAYRRSFASAWLQHALYRSSIAPQGAARWVANMTDKEFRALASLGIPFNQIDRLRGTWLGIQDEKGQSFGFYTVDVASIRCSVEERIRILKHPAIGARGRFSTHLAEVASISLDGRLSASI